MKNSYIYIGVFLVIVALVLVGILLPKKQTVDLNYEIKLAETGDKVTLNYALYVDGNIIDSSYDRNQPFEFTLGSGQTINGFDTGILGMIEGQEKTIVVSPENGYGTINDFPYKYKEDLNTVLVSINQQTGKDYNAQAIQGGKFYDLYGRKCKFDGFDLNANEQTIACQNKLAGKTLTFKIKLLKIEKVSKTDNLNNNIDLNNILNTDNN